MACWRPRRRYARMSKDDILNDDDKDSAIGDSLLWSRDLEKHSFGEFSFSVVQANEIIEDHSQVETGRDATFIGVYDGHGGPDASQFISDHLFLNLMSGVVALQGKETTAGDFLVLDVFEAGLAPQIEPQLKSREDKYVVFISGVSVGSSTSNPLQFQLLVDHITGHLGDEQNLASKDQSRVSEAVQVLDILLSQIAAGVSVDIMPGSNDPANFALPQQPLNRCLFPGSRTFNTFNSCTNPHCFELDGVRFLGTSGQNIDDLKKYSEARDELEFMERTLKWRHLAPTAPNTLGCYPFTDRDPFLIESCPHVYFVGNQDKYGTRILEGSEGQMVRLISIPKFCNTGLAVVLNLRNLECHTLSFGAQPSTLKTFNDA
ncbi:DNA polymerase delta small [Salix suchowensis]|nr:DNA polymerase delta small [Salix suchowensis]